VAFASRGRVPLTKRVLDTACICFTLPALVPLAVAISLFIKLVSRGPVLYRQERIGYRETPFQVLKFRSMHVNADPRAHELHAAHLLKSDAPLTKMDEHGDERLIRLGRLLRASGLDELPQLLNVLRGEMSIVGPRPCTAYEYAHLEPHQKTRFHALPGMTGLWQVSGKNTTTFTRMLELDADYVQRWSFALDLSILARTLPVLLRQIAELRRRRKSEAAGMRDER
jgi:exopolysaccharide production protein ExoY